jgi:hypothetical protein
MPSRFRATGGTLLFLGSMATIGSLFLPYFEHGPSLAAASVAATVPSVVVLTGWFFAAVLLARPRTALAGLGLALSVTLLDLPILAAPLVAVVHGHAHAGGGFEVAADGWVLAALGTFYALGSVIALECNEMRIKRDSRSFVALAGAAGLTAAAGVALPDSGVTYYVAGPVAHTVHVTCCGLTQHLATSQLGIDVATIVYAIAIPLLAACSQSLSLRRGLLFGSGIFFAGLFANAVLSSYAAVSSDGSLNAGAAAVPGAALQPDLTVGCFLLAVAALLLIVMSVVRSPSAVVATRRARPVRSPVWSERHAVLLEAPEFPLLGIRTPTS